MNEYRIHIPQADLDDLARRLTTTRFPSELPDAGWDYGIPLARVRELADKWAKFPWREHEEALNSLPHFVTEIDGENVYFIHQRSTNPDAIPLILTHGWPGSVVEFLDLIPRLTPYFHVVVPAIPGFGFSGPTRSRGWGQERVAAAWATLMARLGYDRYGAQGGDWGSGISRLLAAAAPGHVLGVHVNYLPSMGTPPGPLSPQDEDRLERTRKLAGNRHPHQLLFAATPQTIAYAMNDSPAGQLAFIAEKFHMWADPATAVADEVILADVMHYWLTGTFGSAARLVKESGIGGPPTPCPAPLGVAVLPQDIVQSIRPLVEIRHDVRRWTEYPRGGHFAALEVPDLLAEDVTAFFEDLRPRA